MAKTANSILAIRNLQVSFPAGSQSVRVLRGIDGDIPAGKITGILGESGSGKTVAFRTVQGLTPLSGGRVEAGKVIFQGRNLLDLPESEFQNIRGQQISYVFQNPERTLNPHRAVGRQIEGMLRIHGFSEQRQTALEGLRKAGLDDPETVYGKLPSQLSGGQNQRVMIAMSIAMDPQLLIADEPTSSVDAASKRTILDHFKALNETRGMAIVIITHDVGIIEHMCDYLMVFYGGLIMEAGDAEAVLDRPAHPYTDGLLHCARSLDKAEGKLYSLEGRPPNPTEFTDACPFAPRCRYAVDDCRWSIPPMLHRQGRRVRCLKPLGAEGGV